MREFTFEYTDSKFTFKLVGLSFLIFILLLIGTIKTSKLIGMPICLALMFGLPTLIFFLNRKKIKKYGASTIHDSFSEFELSGLKEKADYENIKTYQVERYNGVHLKIQLNNNHNLTIGANSNFCKSGQFDSFCQELESTLEQYRKINNAVLTRKKSMFEQAWMLPFLVIFSCIIVGLVIFALLKEKNIPPVLYTSGGLFISMWVGYLNARNKKSVE